MKKETWLTYVWACENKNSIRYSSYTYFEDTPGMPGDLPYPKSGTLAEIADFYIKEMDDRNIDCTILIENKIPTDSAFQDEDWFYFTRDFLYRKLSKTEMEQLQKEIKERLSGR